MEEKKQKDNNTGAFIFIAVLAGIVGYKAGNKSVIKRLKKDFDVIRFTNGTEKIFFYYNKKQQALVDDFCLDHAKMREELRKFKEGK